MASKLIGPLSSAIASVGYWFGRGAIEAWFFDKVIHVTPEPSASALVQYGPPTAFAALTIWLLIRNSEFQWSRFQFAFPWPQARTDARKPIWKVVEHVRNAIHDTDAKEVYPAARAAIRQAALDGRIHIYGHKSDRPYGEHGLNFNMVSTLIPQQYWENAEIGPLATEAQWADRFDFHTFPHRMSEGRYGEPIEVYAKCMVVWREVLKQWR